MYIGRVGKFILRPPFTKYGTSISGKIIEVIFIQSAVKDGKDISSSVYQAVDYVSGYATDYKANVILVTIDTGTREYVIPDIYIENLNDDSLNFGTAYCTAKIGLLPLNYDFTEVANSMADEIAKVTGLELTASDVIIHMDADEINVLTKAEAIVADAERAAATINVKSSTNIINDLKNKLVIV